MTREQFDSKIRFTEEESDPPGTRRIVGIFRLEADWLLMDSSTNATYPEARERVRNHIRELLWRELQN